MILVIDNYDSFTWNLVQYLGELGADPRVVRNDTVTPESARNGGYSGIIISPGPGTPGGAGNIVPIIRELAGAVPILGVCLGHQAIAEAFGARIVRAPAPVHGKAHSITHDGQGVFAGLKNPLKVGRYHSLMVEPGSLPTGFTITANASDGTIMGLRNDALRLEGVQFHPESVLTDGGKQMLQNFLASCIS